MIQILDEILLAPEHIPTLLALLEQRYLPQAVVRGLTLQQRWVSPPVAVPGELSRLWLLWQVPDVWGYYAMRLGAGAEVREFWAAVDECSQHRHRHVLGAADQPLAKPEAAHHEA